MLWRILLVLAAGLFQPSTCFYDLKLLDILQLPTSLDRNGNNVYGGINLGAAKAAAYDFKNYILYIIGDKSHFLHVVDISNPSDIRLEFIHQFTMGEGIPQSIDVCGDEVAVALSSQTDTLEGHIQFFHTYQKGASSTDLTLDGYVTVGPHPSNIKFTPDCNTLIVANEGQPGKDQAGTFVDPDGSISLIMNERTGNPSVKLVDFQEFDVGESMYNQNLRVPSMYIPLSTHSPMTKISKDIEPEHVSVSADSRKAWVSLQDNDAVAEVDLQSGTVTSVNPLPKKDWSNIPVDVSDRDGGVHRRTYNGLLSLRQPGKVRTITLNKKTFLVTADEGESKSYTSSLHTFSWTDYSIARSIANNIESPELKSLALNDEYLGRLRVSTVDGKNPFTQMYTHLEAFGGRGFSIWDTSDFTMPIFDSDGSLEEYMEAWDKSVFNTDYSSSTATYQSPEMLRDVASNELGAQVTGLDVQDDNGTMFLLAGTWSTGTLFLYTIDTSSGRPEPQFHTVFRQGVTDLPWKDLYVNQTLGDLYISDLGIITSAHSPTDKPIAYVIGEGSGQVSLYEITDVQGQIPGNTARVGRK